VRVSTIKAWAAREGKHAEWAVDDRQRPSRSKFAFPVVAACLSKRAARRHHGGMPDQTVTLAPDLARDLRRLAAERGLTLSELVSGILADYRDDVLSEPMLDVAEDLRGSRRFRETRLGVDAVDVAAWLRERRSNPDAPRPTARVLP
jgi:hypothetical protein